MNLDQWLMNLSPFSHVPLASAAEVLPTALLLATALLLVTVGLAGLRRRDVA